MKQFLEYFYILSKLSTSFILFISLMFMGYLLFNSYKSVNYSSLANDNKVENVINLVKENQKAINNISNKLSNNLQSIKEIKHSFKSENFENNNTQINNLLAQFGDLKTSIINLENKINQLNNEYLYNNSDVKIKSNIEDIKKIIFVKFLNNVSIDIELEALNGLVNPNYVNHIQKIIILKENTYFNYQQVSEEFQEISQVYLKEKILKKNNNYLINFLSPILDIKPSDSGAYSNKDLSLMTKAEEFLDVKNFRNCIQELNKLKFSNNSFDVFKNKINIYADLQENLDIIK